MGSLSEGSLSGWVSVQRGLCLGGSLSGGVSVRGSLSGWVSVQRGLLQEGIYLVGPLSGDLCLGGSLSRETPIRQRTLGMVKNGGTHPTGMHSC